MFELSDESELLSANDSSVVLTTHRIIVVSEKGKDQMMLIDFVSCKMDRKNIGNYGRLSIIFFVLTCLSGILLELSNIHYQQVLQQLNLAIKDSNNPYEQLLKLLTWVFGILFLLSLLLRAMAKRVVLQITGKYNQLEFRVRNEMTLSSFINKLMDESEKRKQEQSQTTR
ncbi:MAG: hypothetical protein ABI480_17190 [Chitinophagaceae bacterium]